MSVFNLSHISEQNKQTAADYLQKQATSQLASAINSAKDLLRQKAHDEYFRDSSIELVEQTLLPILERYASTKAAWDVYLDERSIEAFHFLSTITPLEQGVRRLQNSFENAMLKKRANFFDQIETNPLTLQQRQAVIRNNDLNLVLAAAGTGKTSVMVAKAIDLIDTRRAAGKEILVLTYNNSAAKELRERVTQRGEHHHISVLNGPLISTFHALGRNILKECNIPVHMSVMADDPLKMNMWVTSWLNRYIQSSTKALQNFILLTYRNFSR